MAYLSEEQVSALRAYRYKGSVSSYIDTHVLGPFWNWIVNFVPLWVAPNLITLSGFIVMVFGTSVVFFHSWDLKSEVPSWCWILLSGCLFIYQTLDAIDGKQARRTGTSSPLGQLFDHGCDALITVFVSLSAAAMLKSGGRFGIIVLLIHCGPFFIANWEEFQTGEMRFGKIGVTEAQLIEITCFLTTAIFGQEFWTQEIIGFERRQLFVSVCIAVITYTTSESLLNVISLSTRLLRRLPESFLQLSQFMSWATMSLIWAYSQNSKADLFPISFLLSLGLGFSFLMSRYIISYVTRSSFQLFQYIFWPLPLIIANTLFFRSISERTVIMLYLIFCTLVYFHFVITVIKEICSGLKISCFVIPSKACQERRTR